jgi:hypothetical protein
MKVFVIWFCPNLGPPYLGFTVALAINLSLTLTSVVTSGFFVPR